ncbi:DUF58 domain-containing protein [Halosimplex sp. J119]
MRPTKRFWVLAALAVAAGGWAVTIDRPVLLAGVCGVCAWLLAQQYRFVAALRETAASLEVSQRSSTARTVTDAATYLTVTAQSESASSLALTVDPDPPVAADGTVETLRLKPGGTDVEGTYEFTWPVAGTFRIGAPTVTARDPLGLFEQRLRPSTEQPAVTVEARRPQTVHVGEGGDPITAGFGEHESGQAGRGLEPAEVRKYVAGDAARRIDWKATARLNETHVREFTSQTDRETHLVVDHRAGTAGGPPGESKLDYARHVALAFVDHAEEASERIGCQTVGDEGLTGLFEPRTGLEHLRQIRRHLNAITPTGPAETGDAGSDRSARRVRESSTPTAPERVRVTGQRLAGDDSAFASGVGPFFDRPDAYVRTISDRPLFRAVETAPPRVAGSQWTIIVTDDERRTELREAVKLASDRGPVLVFMTPTALFRPGGLENLDAAYDAYLDFEEFRRDLTSLPGVTAFEVGPADRLSTVLANAPDRRTVRQR